MDVSPAVLGSMGRAPNIHNRLTRYIITPHGGKLLHGLMPLACLSLATMEGYPVSTSSSCILEASSIDPSTLGETSIHLQV